MNMHRTFWSLLPLTSNQYLDLLPTQYSRSSVEFAYTIYAGSKVCQVLKIANYAYRVLQAVEEEGKDNKQNSTLVLIVKLSQSYASQLILAPLFVIKQYGRSVYLNRINLGVQRVSQIVVPRLETATQLHVYLNSNSTMSETIRQIISEKPFIVSTYATEYFLNISCLSDKKYIKTGYNQNVTKLREKIGKNKITNKLTYFLKLTVKGTLDATNEPLPLYLLFIPSQTKLIIHKKIYYSDDFITSVEVPKLHAEMYSNFEMYKQLKTVVNKQLDQRTEKKMILLSFSKGMGKGLGISTFLHDLGQKNEYRFERINCKYFGNQKQLFNRIENINSESNTLIYVKNIEWLQQVGSDKADSQQKMKIILHNLEDIFMKMGDQSFSSHILVIAFSGNTIRLDMTKNAILHKIIPCKEDSIRMLANVVEYFRKNSQLYLPQEDEALVNSNIGWAQLQKILTSYVRVNQMQVSLKDIMEEVGKFTEIQKVENVKNVNWDDVGGLETAKEEIIQTILLPSKHPQIFDEWIKPRTGLLFYGPPGTGKTLLGKCIANQCKMGFISVKGPELLNMYIGQSEKNVREVFERASASKPCIIFMDELDALIPKRGNSSDSNQVMDRIVSELLMQMDAAAGNGIFIIGATNRPDLLDPSILRPGRFDKQIYLGISKDEQSRVQILKAQTRNIKLSQNFNYQKVVKQMPQNLTGADFYGLTSRSIMCAAEKLIEEIQNNKQMKEQKQNIELIVNEQDFLEMSTKVKPSVSHQELLHYEKLRESYK